jgi:hypothetical protein
MADNGVDNRLHETSETHGPLEVNLLTCLNMAAYGGV